MVTTDEPLGLDEICDKIHARAYTKDKISLDGLSEKKKQTLTHVLRSLLAEREEEVLVREQLLARHRALEHKLEQYERSMKQGEKGTAHAETKLHTIQSQLQQAQSSLANEQRQHRATHEQLQRTSRQLNQVKLAASQHRAATERRSERIKERLATVSQSQLKALVPDIRIASPAFVARANESESMSMEETQRKEAEKRNVALLETTLALKQLALDAMITLHEADVRLRKILDVEQVPARSSLRRSRSRASIGELEVHQVFPPLRPLVTDDTEDTHPARKTLAELSAMLQTHVAELSQWAAWRHASSHASGAEPEGKRRRVEES